MKCKTSPQVGKKITEEGLTKDLAYVLGGILVHEVLSDICAPRPGLKVLEPGCGSGKLGIWYSIQGAVVDLLDFDPCALDYAKELYRRIRAQYPKYHPPYIPTFFQGSIHRLPFPTNSYDFVFNEGLSLIHI